MADEPKTLPGVVADLTALTARVKTLEGQMVKAQEAEAARKGSMEALAKKLTAGPAEPKPHHPWRHRETGTHVRIIEQGNDTRFETEDGKKRELPTQEFNSQFEDATQAN